MSLLGSTNLSDITNTTSHGWTPSPNVTTADTDWSNIGGSPTKYGIVPSIVAAVCFIFGVLYTFFGYRFFKAIMFLTGFIFGAVLIYKIIQEQNILPPEGILGCAAGGGILLGLVTMLIQHTGLFLTGFNLGVAAVAVVLVAVEQFVHLDNKWIPIGSFLVLGVLCGILSLVYQKVLTIIGTSVFGAALGLAGVDYFVELARMAHYLWDRVTAERSQQPSWHGWIMFSLWPVCACVGAVVQWKVTSPGVNHKLALRSRREQGANLQQVRAHEKRETQQVRYRHLYQARRVKGDVISQNFVQNVQQKMSPASQSLTAVSTDAIEEESTATTTLTHVT